MKDPHGGYPSDANLVIYEVTDEDTYQNPAGGHIAIYDVRQRGYWVVLGHIAAKDPISWGQVAANAFYYSEDERRGELVKGHPFDDPSHDIDQTSILAWVTPSVGKYHRPNLSTWPHFHIGHPALFDAIGRAFLAGVIAYAAWGDAYTPWHICYNWNDDDGCHRVDCPERQNTIWEA